jgi:hypothetical protein
MKNDDKYTGIILEEIRDQNRAVLEGVGQIQETVKTLATQESLNRLEQKVDTIQFALTDTNQDLHKLDLRVTKLEQAA